VKGTGRPSDNAGPGGYDAGFGGSRESNHYADPDGYETVPAWECAEDCPVRLLDEQSGERPTGGPGVTKKTPKNISFGSHRTRETIGYADTGGASRFFYCAKSSRRERTMDAQVENGQPCVKPLKLMRYLVRLTKTPTGGVVLDPFMGSGSTAIASIQEGRSFIGIEQDADAFATAEARIEIVQNETRQLEMVV
jgi:site-specific DNA-methyltransferase (adenine-specific)